MFSKGRNTRFMLLMVLCSLIVLLALGQGAFFTPRALAAAPAAPLAAYSHLAKAYRQPVVTVWSDRINVVFVGLNGNIWYTYKLLNGGWQPLVDLGVGTFDRVDAVSWADNRMDVFASNGASMYHKYLVGTTWGPTTGWEYLGQPDGNVFSNGFDVVSWGSGRLDVFQKNVGYSNCYNCWNDRPFYHKWWENGWGTSQTGWQTLDSAVYINNIQAVARASQRLDLFGINWANTIMHKSWDGSNWSSWESMNGLTRVTPLVLSRASDRLEVFVRGYGDDQVWHGWWDGTWHGCWTPMGGNSHSGEITGATWGPSRMDIYEGRNDGIWHNYFNDGGDWSGWTYFGNIGGVTSAPVVVAAGANHLELFSLTSTGQIWSIRTDTNGGKGTLYDWDYVNP